MSSADDQNKHSRRKSKRPFNRRRKNRKPTAQVDIKSAKSSVPNKVKANSMQSQEVDRLLDGIGPPPATSFKPDDFQLEALSALEKEDVLVTAPTGSGKTWIAREEIRRLLEAGRRAWYTSPLKALTNSKYEEFCAAFGKENVGILTGDRKENSQAPLIVGTTEIFRNQLFDLMRFTVNEPAIEESSNQLADLVVLDEAHFLSDEERGHIWEEIIILTPRRVRMLLLSATIGNASELGKWIAHTRGTKCKIIGGPPQRPVELRPAFLGLNGELAPLFDQQGKLNQTVLRLAAKNGKVSKVNRRKSAEIPPAVMIEALRSYNLLPAIIFLNTRRQCDEAALDASLGRRAVRAKNPEARRRLLEEMANVYPELRGYRHWEMVLTSGIASHHAGHLPAWKLVIERLMSTGLLNAIFATSTVAAGVDYPARTVLFTNSDTRGSNGWTPLGASQFQQMTGRAGRRGRDKVGFVIAAPGPHQNLTHIASLLKARPDRAESQFQATYTTLLNLLDAFGSFAHIREIVERSFQQYANNLMITRLERRKVGIELETRSTLHRQAWEPFERRAHVLAHFNYLNFETQSVTDSGRVLADLRVDRPLLVGEAINRGLMNSIDAPLLAGLIASLASDSDRNFGDLSISDDLYDLLGRLMAIAREVTGVEYNHGVVNTDTEINYSAAATAMHWAQGRSWDELVTRTGAEEGDLVRMFSRTGESLLQICGVKAGLASEAVRVASRAATQVLREPVRSGL